MIEKAEDKRHVSELLATYFNTYREHPITINGLLNVLKLDTHRSAALYTAINLAVKRHPGWMQIGAALNERCAARTFKSKTGQWTPEDFDTRTDPEVRKKWQEYYRKLRQRRRAALRSKKEIKKGFVKHLHDQVIEVLAEPFVPAPEAPSPIGLLTRLKNAEAYIESLEERIKRMEEILS